MEDFTQQTLLTANWEANIMHTRNSEIRDIHQELTAMDIVGITIRVKWYEKTAQ